jgi:23S rRNA G2069 N7-methylase RlmK/C1962 C5-methylase RlmI
MTTTNPSPMLAVAAAITMGDTAALVPALERVASHRAKVARFLCDLNDECKAQRAAAPSDLNGADDYLRDYLRLNEDVAGDYLNIGELPALNGLVADLFDDAHADPVELVVVLKAHMRKHGLAALDAAYDSAKLAGAFR